MKGIRFTRNRQSTRSFEKSLAGNLKRPLATGLNSSSQVTSAMGIPFPDLGAFFSKLKFRETDFHNKNLALSLAFIMRFKATRKWSVINLVVFFCFEFFQ